MASALAGGATAALLGETPAFFAGPGAVGALIRIPVVSAVFGVLYLGAVILLHRGYAPLSQLSALLREMIPRAPIAKPSAAGVL